MIQVLIEQRQDGHTCRQGHEPCEVFDQIGQSGIKHVYSVARQQTAANSLISSAAVINKALAIGHSSFGHVAFSCYRSSPLKPLRFHALPRAWRRHSTFA